jgi:hypothetical protein
MKLDKTPTQAEMDSARLTYYRCVAGSHTLFWIVVALYMLGSVINWIFN